MFLASYCLSASFPAPFRRLHFCGQILGFSFIFFLFSNIHSLVLVSCLRMPKQRGSGVPRGRLFLLSHISRLPQTFSSAIHSASAILLAFCFSPLFLSSFMVSSNLRDSLLYSPSTSSSSLPSRLSPCFLLSSRLHLPHWHLTISLLLLSPFFRFPTVNWLLLALFYLFCLLHPPDWHWQNKPLVSLILQYHPYCVFFVIVFLSYSFQIHIHSSLPSTVSSLSASFPSSLADLSHSSISFPPNPSFSAYSSLASSNIALC